MSASKTITTIASVHDFDISGGIVYCIKLQNKVSVVHSYNYDTGDLIDASLCTGLNYPYRIRCHGNSLYITESGNLYVYPNTRGSSTANIPVGNSYGLCIYNNIIYVGTYGATHIYAYNASNLTALSTFIPVSFSGTAKIFGITVANNILYAADQGAGNNRISTVDATTGRILKQDFISGLTDLKSVEIYENNLYVKYGGNVSIYSAITGTFIRLVTKLGDTLIACRMYNNMLGVGRSNSILFFEQPILPSPPIITGVTNTTISFIPSATGSTPITYYYSFDGNTVRTDASASASTLTVPKLTATRNVYLVASNLSGYAFSSTYVTMYPTLDVIYSRINPPRVVNSTSGSGISQNRKMFVSVTSNTATTEKTNLHRKTQTSVGKLSGSDVVNSRRVTAIGVTEFGKKI